MIPVAELKALTQEARSVTAGLSRDAMRRRPTENSWSVAECLDHLNSTNRLYVAAIRDVIEEGRARGVTGSGEFKMSLMERLFVWIVGPPPRMKVKAPKPFLPGAAGDPDEILADWETLHRALIDLAARAEGLHLTKLRVPSPGSDKVKISLLAAFHLIVAHDRRHLLQARRVRESLQA